MSGRRHNGGQGARGGMLQRLTMLGEGGVGKTALTTQFTSNQFVEAYDPTIEDCHRKQWLLDGEQVFVEVLDTAGQEEFTALRNQWIKDGDGFLLVYSIASAASYHRVADLFERIVQIKRQLGIENPCVVLVGNKCDRQDREVSYDAGASLAQRLGVPYFFETSARSNLNVHEAFHTLTRAVLQSKNLSPVAAPGQNGSSTPRRKKKRSGCTIL